jgi:Leucine-rich repeat (LRR) protein
VSRNLQPNDVSALHLALKLQDMKAIRVWKSELAINSLRYLVELIISKKNLTNIDLISVVFPLQDQIHIPRMALHMQNIVQLKMDHTDLSTISTRLFQALYENALSSLITLSMRFCNLQSICSKSLWHYISNSSSLENLYLGGNQLRDESLKIISESILTHPSLKTLDLSFNEIECRKVEGLLPFQLLCQAMASNSRLSKVVLSGNFFGLQGYQSVIHALETRKQMMDSGIPTTLQIDVSEQIENILYEKIFSLQVKSKKGKRK